jgi:hypothetical protein
VVPAEEIRAEAPAAESRADSGVAVSAGEPRGGGEAALHLAVIPPECWAGHLLAAPLLEEGEGEWVVRPVELLELHQEAVPAGSPEHSLGRTQALHRDKARTRNKARSPRRLDKAAQAPGHQSRMPILSRRIRQPRRPNRRRGTGWRATSG